MISAAYVFTQIPGAAVGFVIGAFTPSIGRIIKGFFVKETKALKASAVAEEQKIFKKL